MWIYAYARARGAHEAAFSVSASAQLLTKNRRIRDRGDEARQGFAATHDMGARSRLLRTTASPVGHQQAASTSRTFSRNPALFSCLSIVFDAQFPPFQSTTFCSVICSAIYAPPTSLTGCTRAADLGNKGSEKPGPRDQLFLEGRCVAKQLCKRHNASDLVQSSRSYYDLPKICLGWKVGRVPSEMSTGELPLGSLRGPLTCDPLSPLARAVLPVCASRRGPNSNDLLEIDIRVGTDQINSSGGWRYNSVARTGPPRPPSQQHSLARLGIARRGVNCQLSITVSTHATMHGLTRSASGLEDDQTVLGAVDHQRHSWIKGVCPAMFHGMRTQATIGYDVLDVLDVLDGDGLPAREHNSAQVPAVRGQRRGPKRPTTDGEKNSEKRDEAEDGKKGKERQRQELAAPRYPAGTGRAEGATGKPQGTKQVRRELWRTRLGGFEAPAVLAAPSALMLGRALESLTLCIYKPLMLEVRSSEVSQTLSNLVIVINAMTVHTAKAICLGQGPGGKRAMACST
ncbi:hypothetical protein NPX13_g1271 [Xylaria arbuscula]|uniref:Uncharacterized protein n=1 Tax=Xylaria arbuscula TaxID=114810 RepID=A0A9W8TPT2_9PEZI|nr:hypothetical protein NPX13_g1271 [Xylaria arbuscula]